MNTEMFEEWFGLAQALDQIGDRWTLLIVRELLLGPRRSEKLHESLPGLAPSVLFDRLREMDSNGLVVRRLLDGAYELTDGGRGLERAVVALIGWGGRSLQSSPLPEGFRAERLALALEAALPANEDDPSLELRVATGGVVVRVAIADETIAEVETAEASEDIVDLVVSGDRRLLVALAAGYLSIGQAEERGVLVHGAKRERRPLERVIA
jgi:DNA-binding HxlR family transcriptional regulator